MLVVRYGAFGGITKILDARDDKVVGLLDCDHNEYKCVHLTEADLDLIEEYLQRHTDRVAKFMLVDELFVS
tara:strand:+ start:77 stop:289 length:213 start_codon:yes stop_codon:yes gene_type:complete